MKKTLIALCGIVTLLAIGSALLSCNGCSCSCKGCKDTSDCKQCDCKTCYSGSKCDGCTCEKTAANRPLNVSIFIDLSNRLTTGIFPSNPQMQLDTAIVGTITDWFKEQTAGAHILKSQNRIKVFFHPAPSDSAVIKYAQNLDYDITKYKGVQKTKTVNNLHKTFMDNLTPIYDGALRDQKWLGSDIWGFFSNGVVDQLCVRKGYRNILFIITDGYLIYMPNQAIPGANLTPSCLNNPAFELAVKRKGLGDLEVCMLEINPNHPTQREPLIKVLKNWFMAMGVKQENLVVATTDLPNNTATIIDNFVDK